MKRTQKLSENLFEVEKWEEQLRADIKNEQEQMIQSISSLETNAVNYKQMIKIKPTKSPWELACLLATILQINWGNSSSSLGNRHRTSRTSRLSGLSHNDEVMGYLLRKSHSVIEKDDSQSNPHNFRRNYADNQQLFLDDTVNKPSNIFDNAHSEIDYYSEAVIDKIIRDKLKEIRNFNSELGIKRDQMIRDKLRKLSKYNNPSEFKKIQAIEERLEDLRKFNSSLILKNNQIIEERLEALREHNSLSLTNDYVDSNIVDYSNITTNQELLDWLAKHNEDGDSPLVNYVESDIVDYSNNIIEQQLFEQLTKIEGDASSSGEIDNANKVWTEEAILETMENLNIKRVSSMVSLTSLTIDENQKQLENIIRLEAETAKGAEQMLKQQQIQDESFKVVWTEQELIDKMSSLEPNKHLSNEELLARLAELKRDGDSPLVASDIVDYSDGAVHQELSDRLAKLKGDGTSSVEIDNNQKQLDNILNLEAETAKVAEQMLTQQAKEKQAREKKQQEKAEQAKERNQQEKAEQTLGKSEEKLTDIDEIISEVIKSEEQQDYFNLTAPQAGTSFDRNTIFKLEAETAKVAEQMLAQQTKEKQAREKRQQEKEQQARESSYEY
ncbi:hypothetical protein [Spiroplasma endosymbiont of Tipula paludosa]|uniref:hypothetical protein n=1 Tax=Spiroplasma endosymbiont of Tipula paludosa TaxID=3066295 RepID=UPI0035C8827F